jgi:formimidoylglutamate deiminase
MRGALPAPDGSVAPVLLAAATTGGAQALGVQVGRIAAGCWGDMVAIDLRAPSLVQVSADHLLDALVFGAGNEVIAGTYVGGRWRPTSQKA